MWVLFGDDDFGDVGGHVDGGDVQGVSGEDPGDIGAVAGVFGEAGEVLIVDFVDVPVVDEDVLGAVLYTEHRALAIGQLEAGGEVSFAMSSAAHAVTDLAGPGLLGFCFDYCGCCGVHGIWKSMWRATGESL